MAEEKLKKSIIASDDSDDEYSGDTVSEQTELSSILGKLSIEPEKEKKKLLVLSLSGLLLHRVHKKEMRKKPKNRSPDASCGPNLVYKRPFSEEFMKFCLERFEVGIWSSACELDQEECTDSGFKTLENRYKPLFFKDLSKVFQCFKGFSASNTIFIDDEPYKALRNPDNTGLFPMSYDPSNKSDSLLDPEGEFCSYLDGLAKSSDVQAYIKEHSFGQPKIDSSHPDWSFYRKVSKIVS
ncbi:NLI interacting factor family protein [Arabidopsis lyrata subsp. lyrata]|uniref:Mitochondrial import inner membrane translocase subunit TIM50 n=1 Tax=Arabidopsis lyrata subsp. lyrata TaxID=81972 RepID=D7LJ49_ARALL|nr:NLI interacting factor family protein [Arabidopsis lyrata subsp. lyrata]